eukprot:UN08777
MQDAEDLRPQDLCLSLAFKKLCQTLAYTYTNFLDTNYEQIIEAKNSINYRGNSNYLYNTIQPGSGGVVSGTTKRSQSLNLPA